MEITNIDRQEMNTNSLENVAAADEKKPLPPPPEHAPKCPRCDSENTKFCYYNNYSMSQPRYFCKSCRRYWTKGGTLRHVPIGGGCRKNKRPGKRSLDRNYNHDLLLQSLVENNNNMLSSSSDQNVGNIVFSNFSSPLSYESSGSGESLSMAFARLQKQCDGNGHLGLGFGFDIQNFTHAHPFFGNPVMTSSVVDKSSNLGFLNSFSECQTTQFDGMSLCNYGLLETNGNQGYGHTQPLLPYEDLSFDLMSVGGGIMKQDMCDNRILREFPWQMGNNNGVRHEGLSLENNKNNVVLCSGSSSVVNGFESVAEGRESWNNNNNMSESASAPTWPNLINTSVLM